AYCGKQNIPLQIEHIHPKSKGGRDRVSNLCLACEKCNQKKGNKPIEEFLNKKPDLLRKIKTKARQPLTDAAVVNTTRNKIVKALKAIKPVVTGTGAQTKYNRTRLGFPKQHWVDAACVGEIETLVLRTSQPLLVTCKGQGGRQKAALNKYGYPIRHNPLKPIRGWATGDIAKHQKLGIGKVTPRSKGSFGFTPLGAEGYKSCRPQEISAIHRKDGYTYSFC
ncbi:MAG: HNH endonuclease, partial [Moorea sp. SIO2I5]|nr:HNH endonuclease [Moorena sp. SIO2I5]